VGSNPTLSASWEIESNMFNFQKKKKETSASKELGKQVKALQERLEKTNAELADLKKAYVKAIARVGIVRFNPFGDIGGNQSFCVALLDSEDSGIVITSHYGKDVQRLYAKPIVKGKSEYALSGEEHEALLKAKSLRKSK
jgi:hypothetical protein